MSRASPGRCRPSRRSCARLGPLDAGRCLAHWDAVAQTLACQRGGRQREDVLTAIERVLRPHSPGARAASRLGAVIFIHRFDALLNTHLHFDCIVVDGVFEADAEGGAAFHPASGLDAPAIGEVPVAVRRRLLRAALRRGLLSSDNAQVMAT